MVRKSRGNERIGELMEAYFKSYKRRFPHKSLNDAIKATKNYTVGYLKSFGADPCKPPLSEKINAKLNELRLKDC